MRARFPQFNAATNRGNWVRWVGTLKPTALSRTYTVEIAYEIPGRPEIRVVSPALETRPGCDRLPHVFSEGQLCVHQAHEWRGDQVVARSVVPWVSAWLYFYEVWHATGLWLGEGTHPDLPQHRTVPGAAECTSPAPRPREATPGKR